MGNCLRYQSSMEEAGSFVAPSNGNEKTTTEVKIKITKKQLEELIGKMEVKEIGIEHILSHLVKHSHQYHSFHRPWRPALYSIPEI